MECVLFIGIQASGKSTFYRERFLTTHVRINLDMLKRRHREQRFLFSCLETQQPFVVDNTNPTRAERRVYIEAARQRQFRVVGYYFQSRLDECAQRNAARLEERQIPLKGLLGTSGRLELPSRDEGFDELYYVKITEAGGFSVEEWLDEV